MGTPEIYVDISTDALTEEVVDDATWDQKVTKLQESWSEHRAGGGIFALSFPAGSSGKASKEKKTRVAAALLIRMMTIISLLIASGRHYILVLMWPLNSEEDIRKHTLARTISTHGSSGYDFDPVSYQGGLRHRRGPRS